VRHFQRGQESRERKGNKTTNVIGLGRSFMPHPLMSGGPASPERPAR